MYIIVEMMERNRKQARIHRERNKRERERETAKYRDR
jgi:hypothetical protein